MPRSIFKNENKTWNNDTDVEKAVHNFGNAETQVCQKQLKFTVP